MTFALGDAQTMMADMLDRLFAKENSFEMRRLRASRPPQDPLALWPILAEQGILGALFPESYGGFGGSVRDLVVLMQAVGGWLAGEPVLAAAVCGRILQQADDVDWAQTLIAAIRAGLRIPVFAHAEGFTPFAPLATQAVPARNGYLLRGQKLAVRHADIADLLLVSANLQGAPACFLVEGNAVAKASERFRLIDGSHAVTLQFQDSPARLLLAKDRSAAVLADAIDWWLVGLAAETSGILSRLNSATFEYLRTRKQFGVPLASFQALQHRAADMHIASEQARAVTDHAAEALDSGAPARSRIASAAKAISDEAGRSVGHEAVQMHGGMGVSDELDISHYMRRLAAIRAEAGSADIHCERFGAVWGELYDVF